jgi:hypothetical protein
LGPTIGVPEARHSASRKPNVSQVEPCTRRIDAREQTRVLRAVARENDAAETRKSPARGFESRTLRSVPEQHEADGALLRDDLERLDQPKLTLVGGEPTGDEREACVAIARELAENFGAQLFVAPLGREGFVVDAEAYGVNAGEAASS